MVQAAGLAREQPLAEVAGLGGGDAISLRSAGVQGGDWNAASLWGGAPMEWPLIEV